MTMLRDRQSRGFLKASEAVRKLFVSGKVPKLDGLEPTRRPEAWFLGPKAENLELFERVVMDAMRDHAFWRRNFHPGDPIHITEEIKRSPEYLAGLDALVEGHRKLLGSGRRVS